MTIGINFDDHSVIVVIDPISESGNFWRYTVYTSGKTAMLDRAVGYGKDTMIKAGIKSAWQYRHNIGYTRAIPLV